MDIEYSGADQWWDLVGGVVEGVTAAGGTVASDFITSKTDSETAIAIAEQEQEYQQERDAAQAELIWDIAKLVGGVLVGVSAVGGLAYWASTRG